MLLVPSQKVILTLNSYVSYMKGRRNSVINMYHCKNCDINFLVPLKLHGKYDQIEFVCPECKSHEWGHIW
jgi:hypothetical protein